MVTVQQVLDRLNDLFGNKDFTHSQKVSFLEALLRTVLDDDGLVQQAKVNSARQFAESPDFDDAVTGAAADDLGALEDERLLLHRRARMNAIGVRHRELVLSGRERQRRS